MKKFSFFVLVASVAVFAAAPVMAKTNVKSKFYDFSDQLIDGDIKKPQTLFTDARQKVKFERLLTLKKSFIDPMLQTAKETVFK